MTTHEHLSIEILADYAEGLLGDADATSVAEHLATCADCQAEADLLVSVSTILAADNPGPMPAHYAARIDAALADLAAAEPVTPKRRDSAPAQGATVVDLASRRRFTPAARVTSVAASLVLLIGGVALGMQALDNTNPGNSDDSVAIGDLPPSPLDDSAATLRASLYAQVQKPVGPARKKGKNGAIIDKTTGTVFIGNKVLFPDGTVVVHRKSGIAEVRTFNPSTGEVRVDQVARPPKAAPAPPTPGARVATTPEVTPERTPEPTPVARPDVPPTDVGDPYVTDSGDAYTPDNFATKVQALLRGSGDVVDAPAENGQNSDQNRASASALRSQETAVVVRGPAPAEVAAKVKRCANQLGLSDVLAGDAGTWRGEPATILVTRLGSGQATGYVVYGDCTKEAPATRADVQWEQRVDLPTKDEQPTPSPTADPGNGDTVNDTVTSSATNGVPSSKE